MLAILEKELCDLINYPLEKLQQVIRDVGFECDCCTRCCTQDFNGHVFLLDTDATVLKQIAPTSLTPAPYYEFCDNRGCFYVSGYALKTKPDNSCVFLEHKLCRIYDERPSICRIYPYMLHREEDPQGNLDWRQVSGLNEHGCYHNELPGLTVEQIAKDTKSYEINYLRQQITFMNAMQEQFKKHNLKHVQRNYDQQMRLFEKGGEIEIMVFYQGMFEKHTLTKYD